MSERNRRQFQNQRTLQLSQPLDQSSHRNRSTHRDSSPDNNPIGDYRHLSTTTTTTTTDPSSIGDSSTSANCAISICYSYLIAIISSFLLVLGIYLSLTRFDVRFLYISIIGFLIEAIGACIYCVSNIRSSKLARRKQRVNSDEYILNASGNIVTNDNVDSGNHQITTITHILSSRALASGNTSSCSNLDRSNENEPQTIYDHTNDLHQEQTPSSARMPVNEIDSADPIEAPISPTSLPDGSKSSHGVPSTPLVLDQPSMNLFSNDTPDPTSDDYLSSAHLLGEPPKPIQQVDSTAANPEASLERVIVDNYDNHNDSDLGSDSRLISIPHESQNLTKNSEDVPTMHDQNQVEVVVMRPASILQENPTVYTSLSNSAQANIDTSDLMNPQSLDNFPTEVQAAQKKPPQNRNRTPNLRRTLVMGLSGEEEMIEIDEEDLDNMSILPPSYDSITTPDRAKTG